MKNIAIFASGGGSNAVKIIQYFKRSPKLKVACVVSNNPKSGVLEKAKEYGIQTITIKKELYTDKLYLLNLLKESSIDYIVLAGFLWLVPDFLVKEFPNRIVNIHPSLLPKYGGKGMYGMHVHKAVLDSQERESGMSIHYVNEKFDEGEIIFQAKCEVKKNDTPTDLAARVLKLEHKHYPQVIQQIWG